MPFTNYHRKKRSGYCRPVDEKTLFRKLKNKSIRLGDRVVWAGMLEGRENGGHCQVTLILPSHQENYGMVVAEAYRSAYRYLLPQGKPGSEVINYKAGVVEDDSRGNSEIGRYLDIFES